MWKKLAGTFKRGIISGLVVATAFYYFARFGQSILVSSQSNPFPNIPAFFKSFCSVITLNVPIIFENRVNWAVYFELVLAVTFVWIILGWIIGKTKSKE
jgi:hypothetical protein